MGIFKKDNLPNDGNMADLQSDARWFLSRGWKGVLIVLGVLGIIFAAFNAGMQYIGDGRTIFLLGREIYFPSARYRIVFDAKWLAPAMIFTFLIVLNRFIAMICVSRAKSAERGRIIFDVFIYTGEALSILAMKFSGGLLSPLCLYFFGHIVPLSSVTSKKTLAKHIAFINCLFLFVAISEYTGLMTHSDITSPPILLYKEPAYFYLITMSVVGYLVYIGLGSWNVFRKFNERNIKADELRASENRFRTMFERSTVGKSMTGMDGKLIRVNNVFARMLGYTVEELQQLSFDLITHPDDLEESYEYIRRLHEKEADFYRWEKRYVRKEGGIVWADVSTTIFNDETGTPQYFITNIVDITDRKLAENILQEIIDKNPMSIQIVDENGFTLKVNSAHTRLFGSVPPPDWSIFNDLQLKKQGFEEIFERVKKGEAVDFPAVYFNTRDVSPEFPDAPVWLRGTVFPLYDNNESPKRFVLMHEDITERKLAEDALRESEGRYRSLYDNTMMGISAATPDGRLVHANTAYARMYGYESPEEIMADVSDIGKSFYSNPEDRKEILRILDEKGFMEPREVEVFRRDGARFWVLVAARKIIDAEGKLLYYQATHVDLSERKQAEDALMESGERMSLVLEGSQLGYWDWNIETGEVCRNELWAGMLGYTLEEIEFTIKQWSDLQHPDDREAAWKSIQDHLEGRTPQHRIEYRMLAKDGRYKWILDQAKVVKRDEQGKPLRMCGTHTDITDRKQAEEALRKSEQNFRAVLDVAPFPVAVVDADDEIIHFWSGSALSLFGHTAPTVAEWYQIAYPDPDYRLEVINRWKPFLEIARQSRQPVNTGEYRISCKDGSVCICELYASFLADKLIVTFNDITERKRTEEALADEAIRRRILVEQSSDGIVVMDEEGRVLEANKRFAEMLGYSGEEALQLHIWDWDSQWTQEQLLEMIRLVDEKGDHFETRHRCKNGSFIDVEVSSNGAVCAGKKLVFAVCRDISKRKRAEEEKDALQQQLLQAQKMEAIGTLAGGIAHDFNNMLAVIMGNAQMAKMELSPGEHFYDELNEIMTASNRAKELTMQLLTFARKEKLDIKSVDISSIISDLSIVLSRSVNKKIKIKTAVTEPPVVTVDANQVFQAFLNICNNASDSMPDGGELAIECMKVELDDEYVKDYPDVRSGDYCLVKISDTGAGMPEEVKTRIFEPFFTTKSVGKGTGLGLSITHGIIKSHNGHIEVDSEPGKGTIFYIYLPLLNLKEQDKQKEDAGAVLRGDEGILIVDDEDAVAKVGEKMLLKCGYRTFRAKSGKEALATYNKNRDKIDLVVLDMIMPEMDGQDVYRALVKINPDVKVIIASGYSSDGRISALLDEGVEGFIQKPFKVAELSQLVRSVLDD
ncbi:MAG: PAS domain S-box protein [bacterium]